MSFTETTTRDLTQPAYGTTPVDITNADRPMPWNVMGDGLAVEDAPVAEVLARTGLDFQMQTMKVTGYSQPNDDEPLALADFVEAPKFQAIVRPMPNGTRKVMGIAKQRYTIVDNADAFAIGDDLRSLGAKIVGAADFHHGGVSLLVVKMPTGITVRTPNGDDRTDLDLLITNPHDGSGSVTFSLTAMRLACTNALQASLGDAVQTWRVRHTASAHRNIDAARGAILKAAGYASEFESVAQRMADQKMTDAQFKEIVAGLWPIDDEKDTSAKATRRQQARDDVLNIYTNSQTIDAVRGTVWGGYNALTEYVDHYRPVRGTGSAKTLSRAEGALAGNAVAKKQALWKRFSAMAGA